jgi:hypothetical protein
MFQAGVPEKNPSLYFVRKHPLRGRTLRWA